MDHLQYVTMNESRLPSARQSGRPLCATSGIAEWQISSTSLSGISPWRPVQPSHKRRSDRPWPWAVRRQHFDFHPAAGRCRRGPPEDVSGTAPTGSVCDHLSSLRHTVSGFARYRTLHPSDML